MEPYRYESIDLEESSFRLIRLFQVDDEFIRGEIFHAMLKKDNSMEYEALSYTWDGTNKSREIILNGKIFPITKNLHLALQHLCHREKDRVLWIDAICIDQDNLEERGHQVQQMSSIYEKAETVIIWLGQNTFETDVAFHYMRQLEIQALDHPCNSWKISDERWQLLWYRVELSLDATYRNSESTHCDGMRTLLGRPWFTRAWILQEVAKARAAKVVCGVESVSARIFAVTPSLMGIKPDPHSQAVLDIMPGPSRKSSWWAEKRDLRTLLHKFRKSRASDPRDIIYALLGISSDRCNAYIPIPNYRKSLSQVLVDTVAYLLHFENMTATMSPLPWRKLGYFLDSLPWLEEEVLVWAASSGNQAVVRRLLDTDKVDVKPERSSRLTPLQCAAQNGHSEVVKLLLDKRMAEVNPSVLFCATVNGHEAIVKLLLNTGEVDINLKQDDGSTLLCLAARSGHEAVVKLLLDAEIVDIDVQPKFEPPSWKIQRGHREVLKLSFRTDKIEVDPKDNDGLTPLSWAARNGHEAIVGLLLATGKVEVNSKDRESLTPLLWAAKNGHEAVVRQLLSTGKTEVSLKCLVCLVLVSWARQNGHEVVAELLLETCKARFDVKGLIRLALLSWAMQNEHFLTTRILRSPGISFHGLVGAFVYMFFGDSHNR